jgi:hypothetical protein
MLNNSLLLSVSTTAITREHEQNDVNGSGKATDTSAIAVDLRVLLQLHRCHQVCTACSL